MILKETKYPKIPKDTSIVELREIDGDWIGGTTGYFAVGAWDEESFAIAVNEEFNLASLSHKEPVLVSDVKIGRCRKVPTPDRCWRFHECTAEESDRGAFMATYVLC